ncbi:MAG: hypothetical protein IJ774_10480, partial [Selenomonadaceae bacterium]|nr:hypothetical protein [Selenomonadaceae bacterium]
MAEVITLTAGADNYRADSSDVVIQALGGNDSIYCQTNDVTIFGSDGNDSLYNWYGDNVSFNGGTGNDIAHIWKGNNSSLVGEAGNDTLDNTGASGWISGDDGSDSINSSGDNATIYGGNDNDNIDSYGNYAYIDGEAGNDVISSKGINCMVIGGDGTDSIFSRGINCTVICGEGNDSIYVDSNSHNSSINGGAGDDTIKVYTGSNISINGGYGNDLVSLHSDSNSGNVVEFSGYGADTVTGFGTNDTLQVAGSYSSQISNSNVMIYVGAGSILLENAASLSSSLNIQTVPAGSFGDTASTPTTSGGLTTGTGQVISNYTGEPVTLSGTFMGATFSGNNFVVNSSAGTLTIQNVTDKIIDLRDGAGNEFVKAYKASAAGIVDGRGISAYEIIEGSAAGTDVILAGDGGSQLWGGADTSADAI